MPSPGRRVQGGMSAKFGEAVARAPLVLIISEHEWASRSLDTVLAPRGYAVLRAYNGEQGLQRAIEASPHAVFIDRSLPDISGLELCQELRDHPEFSAVTPVLLMTPGPVSHDHRVETLRAGAWELVTLPVDAEELLLRLDRYVRAKVEVDRVQDDALVDPLTGFYSWNGTMRRLQELGAAAARFGRPLACVVITADEAAAAAELDDKAVDAVAAVLREGTRKSDVLGRIGPRDFAVIAPDTPPEGAERLAERIRKRTSGNGEPAIFPTRTGAFGFTDLTTATFDPGELLNRAAEASRGPASEGH